jgi:hypothetical protein
MILKLTTLATVAALTCATQAAAWGDMYMGDGTHNPNSPQATAYHGPNYCPAGLQPVVLNGVIFCGTAARGYTAMPQPKKHKPQVHVIQQERKLYTRERLYVDTTTYLQSN